MASSLIASRIGVRETSKDGGEIGLVQAFADLKPPLHDHVAQTLGGGFVQGFGADDCRGRGPAAPGAARKKVFVRHVAHGDFASVARNGALA